MNCRRSISEPERGRLRASPRPGERSEGRIVRRLQCSFFIRRRDRSAITSHGAASSRTTRKPTSTYRVRGEFQLRNDERQ